MPNDGDFEAAFKSKSVSSGVAQYILRKFETQRRGAGAAMEVAPAQRAHVDHIYPQNPAEALRWPDHEEWVDRIGNLTLLAGRVNRALTNAPYGDKRPEYAKSGVLITEEIGAKYATWSSGEIEDRQNNLATAAVGIWGCGQA